MPKILVIDDDKEFQDFLGFLLESRGFEVYRALTADEGLNQTVSIEPDLIILDVMMPFHLEGLAVSRKIRNELGMKEVPIIMITAVSREIMGPYKVVPDDFIPVDYFIDKPVDPVKLVRMIRGILECPLEDE
jgi:DNA-binding response OmpR family regulator